MSFCAFRGSWAPHQCFTPEISASYFNHSHSIVTVRKSSDNSTKNNQFIHQWSECRIFVFCIYNGILCGLQAVHHLRLSLLSQTPPSLGWSWLWWLRPASWRLFLSSSTSSLSPKEKEKWITSWLDRAAHSNEATAWDELWYAAQNRRNWWPSLVTRLLFNTPLKWIYGVEWFFFFFLLLSLMLEMKCFLDCC